MRTLRWLAPVVATLVAAASAVAFNGQTVADHPELTGDPWYSKKTTKVGEYFTFYFFNPDGDGIYRFGRLGKVLTERFNWQVSGGVLKLTFANTGEKVKTGFRVEPVSGKKDHKKLTVLTDPRENGQKFEYFRVESGRHVQGADWAAILNPGR